MNQTRIAAASLLAIALSAAPASAEERLVLRAELDARATLGEVSFAEQAGQESRGNDLGLFHLGAIFGIGIDTGEVAILADAGIYAGGLSAGGVAEHYFVMSDASPTPWAFTLGAAARYLRPTSRDISLVGSLRLGYSRAMLSGGESAHLSSFYMEIGGGFARPFSAGPLDARLGLTGSVRAHRLDSFSASNLSEGTLNADSPELHYAPGLSVSLDLLF